jgi:8-oxo-dGTP pyrophosphatase MutT (NUDIX family)
VIAIFDRHRDPCVCAALLYEAEAVTIIHKAAACLVRRGTAGPELLVFRHPLAGVQIPKGSVQPGELPADAALRELAEESGVAAHTLRSVGRHDIEVGAGPTEFAPLELQVWHTFLVETDQELPDSWSHQASGSEVEAGLVFEYFWLPIAEARSACSSRFHASIDLVSEAACAARDVRHLIR